jgi:transcriptional regulator with XRE-family HTH domain
LLRRLRAEAGLTQEELAEAASLSPRSVSDLERGIHATAHKDTAVLLAGALGLAEPARGLFVAAARGQAPAAEVLAARQAVVAGAFAAAAIRGLPRDIAAFTGRQAELAQLMGTLTAVAAAGGVVGICAIDGMAGIGKTTFAVHAAHRLAGTFPDGQFFLPLHGHTRGQRPVDPADALASLLLAAGVPAAAIPPGIEALAVRWRSQVAGKKILLVLDDAAGHEQVRPLLPGTAGRRRRCSPGWRPGPGSVPPIPRWVTWPGWAGTCRWRSGCLPASCATIPPGPPPIWPPCWLARATGWP